MFPAARIPWMDDALCRQTGGDGFYPTGKGQPAKYARQVCNHCPVILNCRWHAINNDERLGIWGGMNYRQRRRWAEQNQERAA